MPILIFFTVPIIFSTFSRKLSPNSQAFRDSVKLSAPTPYAQLARRKSLTVRVKISSPPQMSDISESLTASLGGSSGIMQQESCVKVDVEALPAKCEDNGAEEQQPMMTQAKEKTHYGRSKKDTECIESEEMEVWGEGLIKKYMNNSIFQNKKFYFDKIVVNSRNLQYKIP